MKSVTKLEKNTHETVEGVFEAQTAKDSSSVEIFLQKSMAYEQSTHKTAFQAQGYPIIENRLVIIVDDKMYVDIFDG